MTISANQDDLDRDFLCGAPGITEATVYGPGVRIIRDALERIHGYQTTERALYHQFEAGRMAGAAKANGVWTFRPALWLASLGKAEAG